MGTELRECVTLVDIAWREIELSKIRKNEDQFRCVYFSKLIQVYAKAVQSKLELSK
jgi:hypothetical protein